MRQGSAAAVLMGAKRTFAEREGLSIIQNMSKPFTISIQFFAAITSGHHTPLIHDYQASAKTRIPSSTTSLPA